jgi:FlaA1/EpsC-like NDP-sugar epimerase
VTSQLPRRQRVAPSPRSALRVLVVAAVIAVAWSVAFLVRFDLAVPEDRVGQLLASLPWVVLLQLGAHQLAGANRHSWRYTSLQDLVPLVSSIGATAAALALTRTLAPMLVAEWPTLDWLLLPYGIIGAYTALAILGLVGLRILRRVLAERHEKLHVDHDDPTRVLLLGAGRAGVLVARELQSRGDLAMVPVGFVDDDPEKQGRRISQLDVLGGSDDLEELVERYRIDDIVITIASATGPEMRELIGRCERAGRLPLTVPGIGELVSGKVAISRFRPVAVEDLLGRAEIELEQESLHELLSGDVVLITGAGGSIGSELARQVAAFTPRQLVLVEQAEPALWAIHRELSADHPSIEVVGAIADVTDRCRMDGLLTTHRPSVIFHAAAHKHVPIMEDNPGEAIKNNVLGTRTLVDLAVERDVGRFVLISTDKAVNPTSVMGATKRLAERYVQSVAHATGRNLVAVRFGNVLGSTGSVVPIFQQQIADGGPVTVTHPEMRRYFMTIPEASQLVIQAAALGRSGEVLVLDMGEPIRIVELAESLIRLSGHEPYDDIPIEFSGLRPGEKLYEELSLSEEGAERTRHPKVWIGRTRTPDWPTADEDLRKLGELADRLDARALRHLVAHHVPEVIHGDTTEFHAPATPAAPADRRGTT